MDLGSQHAVREAASEISESVQAIDILINNAAIMACPFAKTADGIESQFGTNYIGHFLLTNLIMERLIARQGRIVNVSSSAHRMSDVELDDWNFNVCIPYSYGTKYEAFTDASKDGNKYNPTLAYVRILVHNLLFSKQTCTVNTDPIFQGRAKTANVLFTVALAAKLHAKHVDSISLHPGCKIFFVLRFQRRPDGLAAIKTNLQTYMTPGTRDEAIKMLVANTGRKCIDHIRFISSSSAWQPKDAF